MQEAGEWSGKGRYIRHPAVYTIPSWDAIREYHEEFDPLRNSAHV